MEPLLSCKAFLMNSNSLLRRVSTPSPEKIVEDWVSDNIKSWIRKCICIVLPGHPCLSKDGTGCLGIPLPQLPY